MTKTYESIDLKNMLSGVRIEIMAREGELWKNHITGTIESMMNQLAEVEIDMHGAVSYPVVILVTLDSPFIDRDYGMEEGVSVRQLFLFVYNIDQLAMLVREGRTTESSIVAYRLEDERISNLQTLSWDDLVGVAKDVDLKLISLAE